MPFSRGHLAAVFRRAFRPRERLRRAHGSTHPTPPPSLSRRAGGQPLCYPADVICPRCSVTALDGQAFCAQCGYRLTTDTLASLGERLASVEASLTTDSKASQAAEQKFLELDTSEKVVARITRWAKLFAFWVGIPFAAVLLLLGMIVGKGALDFREIVTNAKESVRSIVEQARGEASNAKKTAQDALTTSREVASETAETKRKIGELKSQVDGRSAEVQKLGDQIKQAWATIENQSRQVQTLNQQVQALQSAKAAVDIGTVYPAFGEHHAKSISGGSIDPKKKPAGAIYVDLNFNIMLDPSTASPTSDQAKLVQGMTALNEHKYTVIVGPIYTYAITATSNQAVGMGFDGNSCQYWPAPQGSSPCILYFNESTRHAAMEVRDLLRVIQPISDDRIRYVDPKGLTPQKRELLSLSSVDILVVLSP